MGEPVPAVLDYYGCDKQSPDGSCVGLITPQVSCVRAPEDCDKRSLDGSRDAVGRRLVHLLMFRSVHGCMVYGFTPPPNPNPNPMPLTLRANPNPNPNTLAS